MSENSDFQQFAKCGRYVYEFDSEFDYRHAASPCRDWHVSQKDFSVQDEALYQLAQKQESNDHHLLAFLVELGFSFLLRCHAVKVSFYKHSEIPKMIPPLRVALSGGGILGLAHIGALEVLQERGHLKCVKEYLGISAGAMIVFCICIGYTLSELRALITVFNFTKIQNLEPEIMLSFVESYGFDDGANIEKLFIVLLRAKGLSPEITFREFSEKFPERPTLRIFATEVATRSLKEFSLGKTPDVCLKFAIRASVSIPIIFTPVEDLSGSYFVDGGIISNFPFHVLTDEERERAIGITFYKYTIQDKPAKITNIFI